MINLWQTITRGGCVRKAWKPPSSRPILIYFEFRSKPSPITVICMNPPSLAQQILIFCDKILFSHTQRGYQFLVLDYFIIFRFFCCCYFTLLLIFTKNILLFLFYYYYFFHVPECSGMFRNVPYSWFYRRPVWTAGRASSGKWFTARFFATKIVVSRLKVWN